MGFSIGKVFKPIEEEMRKYCEVDSLYLPVPNYKPLGLWKNIRAARAKIKSGHYDVVHITGAEHYLLPFIRQCYTVVTVHDLGFFTNTRLNIRSLWKYMMWIRTLKLANAVTFISDKSLSEARRFVKFAGGQAMIVYNPVGPEYHYVPKKFNADSPRVLHIGTKSNKNLNNTILALRGRKCHLRIIGELTEAQLNMLHIYKTNYSCAAGLTDEEIRQEYEQCDIVNFPSFYEGFGMPIIEGQAVGRPVITSNLSPMKEIAADTAVLVDPENIDSISNGYDELALHYDKLVEAGLKNVERFRLDDIVRQYHAIYQRISNDKV